MVQYQQNNRKTLNITKPFARAMLVIFLVGITTMIISVRYGKFFLNSRYNKNISTVYAKYTALKIGNHIGSLADPNHWELNIEKISRSMHDLTSQLGIASISIYDANMQLFTKGIDEVTCNEVLAAQEAIIYNNRTIGFVKICRYAPENNASAEISNFVSFGTDTNQFVADLANLVVSEFAREIGTLENLDLWEYDLDKLKAVSDRFLHLSNIIEIKIFNKTGELIISYKSSAPEIKIFDIAKEAIIYNGQLLGSVELNLDNTELHRLNLWFITGSIAIMILFAFALYFFSIYIVWNIESRIISANEEIANTQSKLMQSGKMASLGEMAGGIAHEINNPIGIIQGKSNLLLKHAKNGTYTHEMGVTELQKIISMTERITKIVSGLRSFSRNAEDDPFAQANLNSLITNVLNLCTEKFTQNQIKLELGSIPKLSIECRNVQIEQVLLNLLNNAYDAVAVLAEKWVRVDVKTLGEKVQISVTDSGCGIPPDIIEKLMQPFFTTKEVGKGTGLGLSISKGIIENHHGSLHYDASSSNTRFVIELPMRQNGLGT